MTWSEFYQMRITFCLVETDGRGAGVEVDTEGEGREEMKSVRS